MRTPDYLPLTRQIGRDFLKLAIAVMGTSVAFEWADIYPRSVPLATAALLGLVLCLVIIVCFVLEADTTMRGAK